MPLQWLNTRFIAAVLAWTDGDMEGVEAALAEVEETFTPAIWRETGTRLHGGFVRCLASLGPLDPETEPGPIPHEVRDHVAGCASGRVAQMESDGLIVLALLSLQEHDTERAEQLLLDAHVPRSQGSHLLAMHLAEVLGIREHYQRVNAGRRRDSDPDWFVEHPRRALNAELQRRGWL